MSLNSSRVIKFLYSLKVSKGVRFFFLPIKNLEYFFSDLIYKNSEHSKRIASLKGCKTGRRCFIVGNGPSLRADDLDSLIGEDCFAANRIYNIYDSTEWRPTYYIAFDPELITQEAANLSHAGAQLLFVLETHESRGLISQRPDVIKINSRYKTFRLSKYSTKGVFFSKEPNNVLGAGYTVTFTALQLALYMGYKEIYLIGMDHTFTNVVQSDGTIVKNEGIQDHCYADSKNSVITPQFKEGVEYGYLLARYEAEAQGARIFNATRGGALEIFERVNLDDVLTMIHGENNE